MPQFVSNTTRSARLYYAGLLSFTSVSSQVREAALGPCKKYDIDASALCFYLSHWIAKLEDKSLIEKTALYKYVQNKSFYREKWAKLLAPNGNSQQYNEVLIKRYIAAVGFGGREGYHVDGILKFNSLSKIIKTPALREALNNDKDFAELKMCIQKIMKDISNEYRKYESKQELVQLCTENGKLKQSSFVSLLYQEWEVLVMAEIQRLMQKDGHKMLLKIHDGFYTKDDIDLIMITNAVRAASGCPVFNIDKKNVKFYDGVSQDSYAEEHKRRIYQEEAKANGYTSKSSIVSTGGGGDVTNDINARISADKFCKEQDKILDDETPDDFKGIYH